MVGSVGMFFRVYVGRLWLGRLRIVEFTISVIDRFPGGLR